MEKEDERSRKERDWWAPPYEMNRVVRIPEAIPELGVEAGDGAVIDSAYNEGRMLFVEIPREGGWTVGFASLEVLPDGSLHLVGYSTLTN